MKRINTLLVSLVWMICGPCRASSSGEEVLDLGTVVVEALPMEDEMFDHPGHVSVIGRDEIERSNARYVYQLLRRLPGMIVRDFTHAGKTVQVDMRGFGETGSSNLLVLVDGMRLNEIDLSDTDWTLIPVENVERIEVVRGSGSVLYGDNAQAGLVNIVTVRGAAGDELKAGYSGGSYRYHDMYVAGRGARDILSWNFMAKTERTDGYRLNGGSEGNDLFGRLVFEPVEWLDIDVAAGYHKDWYGLPGGLQRHEIDMLGRRGSTTPYDIAKTENTFLRMSPEVTFTDADTCHSAALEVWGRKKRNNSAFPSMAYLVKSQIDSAGGALRYTVDKDMGKASNRMVAGIDLFTAENRVRSQGWVTDQLRISKKTLGMFISDRIDIADTVFLSAGARRDWAEYRFVQWNSVTRDDKKPLSQDAFEAGMEIKYSDNGAVYARYTRGYRYPKTDEFFSAFSGLNTDLKQQCGNTYELGIKEHGLSCFQVDAGVFFIDLDNEIYYDPVTFTNSNYPRSLRKGVEMSLRSEFDRYVNVYAAAALIEARFRGGDYAGNRVPQVPPYLLSWGVDLNPLEWLEIAFDGKYVSSQYPISDMMNHASKLESYMVCNGKVSLTFKGIQAYVCVNNIFDQEYSERSVTNSTATVIDYFPAPGINFEFGVVIEI